jgi:hypothetical protein
LPPQAFPTAARMADHDTGLIDIHFHLIPQFYRDAVYEAGKGVRPKRRALLSKQSVQARNLMIGRRISSVTEF